MRWNLLGRFAACGAMLMMLCAGVWGQSQPTFVGVRTFLGAPYVTNLDELKADFAVLGVPFDEGTWGQPGERYGPRDLRESSQNRNLRVPRSPLHPLVSSSVNT